ncbi:MAG: hypothetical protein E7351_01675 [Clostridiales bacterium]|nr:hypothetical protein [Clostridiales bacterium]
MKTKAIVLVGGFGTRIESVAQGRPKTLLEVYDEQGNIKPIFYFLLDKINKVNRDMGEDVIDEIMVLTNDKYYGQMIDACNNYKDSDIDIRVVSDHTTNNENRLGANGDLKYIKDYMEDKRMEYDHVMILAGDNFFNFDLVDFIDYYNSKSEQADDAVCLIAKTFDKETISYARNGFLMLDLDENDKIVDSVEKPGDTPILQKSNKGAIALYMMSREQFEKIDDFVKVNADNKKVIDSLGFFGQYLSKKASTFAWTDWDGVFVDIGTTRTYGQLWLDYEEKFNISVEDTNLPQQVKALVAKTKADDYQQ